MCIGVEYGQALIDLSTPVPSEIPVVVNRHRARLTGMYVHSITPRDRVTSRLRKEIRERAATGNPDRSIRVAGRVKCMQ